MFIQAENDLEHAKMIEERAHKIKMAMYNDAEFIAGIREGYTQECDGQMMTWAELRQAIGRA